MSQAVSNEERALQQGRRRALSDQDNPCLRPRLITSAVEGNPPASPGPFTESRLCTSTLKSRPQDGGSDRGGEMQ